MLPGEFQALWPDRGKNDRRLWTVVKIGQLERRERAQQSFIADRFARPQPAIDAEIIGQPLHCNRRGAHHFHIGRHRAGKHHAEPVAAHRLHHVGNAGGDQRVAHCGIERGVDADSRSRFADRTGQDRRLFQREPFRNPHRAKADALGFLRLFDAPAWVIHSTGQDVCTELIKQGLGTRLLHHGSCPCAAIAFGVIIMEQRRNQPARWQGAALPGRGHTM